MALGTFQKEEVIKVNLEQIVHNFPTTPFLFVGSGISRRYYNLPDWETLLRIFISRLNPDEFAFECYLDRARELAQDPSNNIESYAIVAGLLENDFNSRWFSDINFRQLDDYHMDFVRRHQSPFKVEIAQHLLHNSALVEDFQEEIDLFTQVSLKSLSGVLTTNFDGLLEKLMQTYKVYIGQEELIFSSVQGLAEIYKIHGSVANPSSMVLTATDYKKFEDNCPYLAAKLMTIFMEYPIIFMGYSISDPNIQRILEAIVRCLSEDNLKKLQNRFIYLEWDKQQTTFDVSQSSITILGKTILMTRMRAGDFCPLYRELLKKKTALPVKVLRMFREEFYTFSQTGKPTSFMRVAGIDDERVDDRDLVLAIGKASMLGLRGLRGLSPEEWYRNIVLGDLLSEFSADDILENAYPSLMQKNNVLPVWRLLCEARQEFAECLRKAPKTLDDVICSSIKRARRTRYIRRRNVRDILADYEINKAMFSIACLNETEINVDDLEAFLKEKLSDSSFYPSLGPNERSSLNRLVRMLDVLKYNDAYNKQHAQQKSPEGP